VCRQVLEVDVRCAGELGQRDPSIGIAGQLTGQPGVRQEVATVRGDLHVEGGVVEPERRDERFARLEVPVELHDAGVIRAEAQLLGGAEHALRHLTSNLGLLDPEVAGKHRPDRGERIQGAGPHVGRAAHDRDDLTAPVDLAQRKPVRVRMGARFEHPADHDIRESRPGIHDLFDGRSAQREMLGQRHRVAIESRHELLEPTIRGFHVANCERKRTSFSKKVRRSPTPCLSIAIRPGPIPKAQPV
jgi:hypothetical protein